MVDVSVLILAKNEERNIEDCIKSCSFAQEIIVIDDYSIDATKVMAEGLGARVIQRGMNGDWGGQQTFAIQQASNKWIFFLDADERVTKSLASAICDAVIKDEKNAYWIERKNKFHYNNAEHGVLRQEQKNIRNRIKNAVFSKILFYALCGPLLKFIFYKVDF